MAARQSYLWTHLANWKPREQVQNCLHWNSCPMFFSRVSRHQDPSSRRWSLWFLIIGYSRPRHSSANKQIWLSTCRGMTFIWQRKRSGPRMVVCGTQLGYVHAPALNFELWNLYSSSTSYVKYQAGGGKGLVDLVNQLTLERCHSFWFYGSCRKRIPIRDSSMPKRILSQCGVSSKMFIGLIVPTTCSSVRWD